MIAQDGYASKDNPVALNHGALASCLLKVNRWISNLHDVKKFLPGSYDFKSSVHAPRLGCGLSGSTWTIVGSIVTSLLEDHNLYIYDLPEENNG
jgi:hypothetical protein